MLGGKIVDNFMDKLAEKIGAQEIIKANAQAEAMEAERTKQEAEQFKLQLEELRQNEKEHRAAIEDARASIQETGKTVAALTDRLEQSETQVHDVGVQVYRNVQAVVEKSQDKNLEEFKDVKHKVEAVQVAVEGKNNAVLPLVIITLLVAGTDLVINILRILGVL
ncbi:hypothetical protein [Butyrivibrio sp. XPD2006]|uniref:hypothetical protein n=1 Tax=Butyrivibrio sp. XPD2006 TaxID=1280668 RepID=UPI0003B72274|nr:hypothetical protein [Butyrivibrio sp. XPD2006]